MSTENQETKTVEVKTAVEPKVEVKEDVTKLSDDQIKWRAKYKETKSEYETIKVKSEAQEKAFQEKFSTLEKQIKAGEQKLIEAELRAAAILEGLNDIDLIKLMDTSNVKVENGEIVGIREVVSSFKERKPSYFGAHKKVSSSTNTDISGETKTQTKSAHDLSPEDWSKVLQRASRFTA